MVLHKTGTLGPSGRRGSIPRVGVFESNCWFDNAAHEVRPMSASDFITKPIPRVGVFESKRDCRPHCKRF
jgi:hypothetical protein